MKEGMRLQSKSIIMIFIGVQTAVSSISYNVVLDKYSYTQLHLAAHKGYEACVEMLLKNGVNKDARDKYGEAPIHCAARKGNGVIVKLLLTAGADKDAQDKDGWTPLHESAQQGNEAVVETLLAAGANKDVQDKHGEAPLHLAVERGHSGVIELLLKAKADVNVQRKKGVTPLFMATRKGQTAVTQILIKAGAAIESEDEFGNTPLSNSLTAFLEKPRVNNDPKVIHMLLLVGNASLKKANNFSSQARSLLKEWGFDQRTFHINLEKSRKLLKKHSQELIDLLEDCKVPKVIAQFIFEYHDCIDTQMLLFTKARLGPLTDIINP